MMAIRRIAICVGHNVASLSFPSTASSTTCPLSLFVSPSRFSGPIQGRLSIISCQPNVTKISRSVHTNPSRSWKEKQVLGVNTPEELEKRLNRFKKLANEARLCIQDCDEYIETEHFDEELQSAKAAVETAGFVYSEILEELAMTEKGVELLNEVRRTYSSDLESLRQDLRNIAQLKDKS